MASRFLLADTIQATMAPGPTKDVGGLLELAAASGAASSRIEPRTEANRFRMAFLSAPARAMTGRFGQQPMSEQYFTAFCDELRWALSTTHANHTVSVSAAGGILFEARVSDFVDVVRCGRACCWSNRRRIPQETS